MSRRGQVPLGGQQVPEQPVGLGKQHRPARPTSSPSEKDHPGVPGDHAQRYFIHPDSRIMPGPGGKDFQESYNCQAVADSIHQVIVAARALNLSPDKRQAAAMAEDAIGDVDAVPKEVSAGAGYYSAKAGLKALGVDSFIEPEKTATARGRSRRPGAVYRVACQPGTR